MLMYKSYIGHVTFDDEANIFHGEVINTRDVITFQGKSVEELKQAFIDSVEDYLAFCRERNEAPEKPFSGKLIIRIEPQLHQSLSILAKRQHTSLNKLIESKLGEMIEKEGFRTA